MQKCNKTERELDGKGCASDEEIEQYVQSTELSMLTIRESPNLLVDLKDKYAPKTKRDLMDLYYGVIVNPKVT